ncbi:MAG TPA: hypothetical protein PLB07_10840 [Bacteroidales bacterium]|jgi:hypothetical protein|nr:hypothetical protein [Bacteroidales bacterium]MDI9532043.1 hypothetical protein [Bacteroidota bacterium]MZQ78802.1 hypothetical protein [Bacteroidales bacterium]HHU98846.1 hypothetical protein [Bacteroidales bacterium]HMT66854.1 hypothetical protein [Bacteroidales bacterium]
MKKNRIINGLLISAFFFSVTLASAQTRMPDELNTAAIREQIEYVEDHTRIYDNFRAIREDIFQKLNKNILDSLTAVKNKVAELKGDTANLISRTDSLNVLLTSTRSQLEEVTATKNKIRVFGMEINKTTYNTIMWILVGGLILLMVLGFLVFKRNLVVLLRTEKDLKELKEEFATYRQTSRIAREKVEMDLFRANQKLKGLV